MSYRCGIAPNLAAIMGGEPCDSHIRCDGCGLIQSVSKPSGLAYTWFLNNKPAPSWELRRTDDPFERIDLCPRCKTTARSATKEGSK